MRQPFRPAWWCALWWSMVIAIPLSVKLYFPGLDLEVVFPAEPLIAIVLLIVLARAARTPSVLRQVLQRANGPLPWIVMAYVVVSLIAAACSTMPLVSLKALAVRCAYIGVFYFGALTFAPTAQGPATWLRLHAFAFLPVMLYAAAAQSYKGFSRAGALDASFPFYTDHTHFSAALCFVVMTLAAEAYGVRQAHATGRLLFQGLLVGWALMTLVFAYSRAAWAGLAAALFVLAWFRVGLRPRTLFLAGAIMLTATVVLRAPLLSLLRANTADSNVPHAGAGQVMASMTNITTDASNVERLDRWRVAYRLFREHPLTGTGPGTYQFHYAALRDSTMGAHPDSARVNESRRTPEHRREHTAFLRENPRVQSYGTGTAHSEYFLALSESGPLALLALLALVVVVIASGPAVLRSGTLVTAAWCGTIAYLVHALFNNFLDDPKVAFPFWISLAVITHARRSLRKHAALLPGASS